MTSDSPAPSARTGATCALILLAAGTSSRMAQPKQLLPIFGKPLLRRVVDSARAAPVAPLVVVLGANVTTVQRCLEGTDVNVVLNEEWAEGVGSSIRAGLEALEASSPELNGVIIALADQPNFSAAHVNRLLAERERTGRSIVATEMREQLVLPAYFGSEFFLDLLSLRGDSCARSLIDANRANVAAVCFDDLEDIDTKEDYLNFLKTFAPA
jgi:molybdenum cofactor cytidylyltransferase